MRFFFIALLLFCPLISWSQGLKIARKYQGIYLGNQSSYYVTNHTEKFLVDSVSIQITIKKTGIDICYMPGGHCVLEAGQIISFTKNSKKSKEIVLAIKNKDSMILEELIYNRKKKSITRLGIFPQPNLVALRSRKK